MNDVGVLESDAWQSLDVANKKLEIAVKALEYISIWSKGLQEEVEKEGSGIYMWQESIKMAKKALTQMGH